MIAIPVAIYPPLWIIESGYHRRDRSIARAQKYQPVFTCQLDTGRWAMKLYSTRSRMQLSSEVQYTVTSFTNYRVLITNVRRARKLNIYPRSWMTLISG